MHADVSAIRSILLGAAALLVTSGCTAHLRPKPELPPVKGGKLKLRAALVIPEAMEKKTDDLGKFDGLGSFAVDTGESVLPAVKGIVGETFETVDVVRTPEAAKLADVVVNLKTLKLVHSNGYQLRFDLRTIVTKQNGDSVIDASYAEVFDGQKKPAATDALVTPTEKTVSDVLARLSADLRGALGAPTGDEVADFSDYPPPPPAEVAAAPAPVVAEEPPAPAAATPVDNVVVAPAPAPVRPKSNAGRIALATGGALLFAAGYAAPPLAAMLFNLPGNTELSWIPVAGPLLAQFSNPFLSQDPQALIFSIAGTAGQVVGLAMLVAGIASGGGSAAPAKVTVLPTIAPGGVGLVVVH